MAVNITSIPLAEETVHQQSERRSIRVVAIGGGTGLSTLLHGLKDHVFRGEEPPPQDAHVTISDLAAIVTVTDDGGSSGRLRKELNMLPPGDVRNCLVSLSEDEHMLSRLFRYRFTSGTGLEGHSFGNLFLAALTHLTGDFAEAVRAAAEILATRGHIYPSTTSNVQLDAVMTDGSRVRGETSITASTKRIARLNLVPANAQPLPQTLRAIEQADLITIGPGSLFTSLVPNLLVRGIPEAIARSKATKVLICNLMTQANESLGLTASQHIAALRKHARMKIFDYALVNDAPVSPALHARYAEQGCGQVICDCDDIEALGVQCIKGKFMEEGEVVRHDTRAVARTLLQLV